MSQEKHHIVPFKTYLLVLAALLTFTLLSIGITKIELGLFSLAGALLFAIMKTGLIVFYFMHLKFEKKIYAVFAGIVLLLFVIVVILTFFDYFFL